MSRRPRITKNQVEALALTVGQRAMTASIVKWTAIAIVGGGFVFLLGRWTGVW